MTLSRRTLFRLAPAVAVVPFVAPASPVATAAVDVSPPLGVMSWQPSTIWSFGGLDGETRYCVHDAAGEWFETGIGKLTPDPNGGMTLTRTLAEEMEAGVAKRSPRPGACDDRGVGRGGTDEIEEGGGSLVVHHSPPAYHDTAPAGGCQCRQPIPSFNGPQFPPGPAKGGGDTAVLR